jgi:predicted amidohydrolase
MRESVSVPGPACEQLAEAARAPEVARAIGVNEHGGTIYNTVLTFGPDGSLLGRYRKLMPTQGERLVWAWATARTRGCRLEVDDRPKPPVVTRSASDGNQASDPASLATQQKRSE